MYWEFTLGALETAGYLSKSGQFKNFTDGQKTEWKLRLRQPPPVSQRQVVDAIWQCDAYGLGESPFDAEVYNIDANGKHRFFYTGFERHELDYRPGTNQVDKIKINYDALGKEFVMRHDGQGNVVQALHKDIDRIEYDATSQRPSSIRMTDGRLVTFAYDVKGERSVKSLWVPDDADPTKMILVQQTCYVRDEDGRVLADQKIVYHSTDINKKFLIRPSLPPMKTWSFYIYGAHGLVGFVRNGDYYNVIADHAGSTRLVLKDGRVVAAYDYLPYGQLMRWSGDDPLIVNYLFTGQEWDRETGIYNFHFRLYDPQINPKEKIFSLRRKLTAVPLRSRQPIRSNNMFTSLIVRFHWSLSRSSGRQ